MRETRKCGILYWVGILAVFQCPCFSVRRGPPLDLLYSLRHTDKLAVSSLSLSLLARARALSLLSLVTQEGVVLTDLQSLLDCQ